MSNQGTSDIENGNGSSSSVDQITASYYCNNTKPIPKYRGQIHKWCLAIAPIYLLTYLSFCDSYVAATACFVQFFACTLYFCWSYNYHCVDHVNTMAEDRAAMYDHLGLLFYMCYCSTPVFMLAIPHDGILFLCVATVICTVSYIMCTCPHYLPFEVRVTRLWVTFGLGCNGLFIFAFVIAPSFYFVATKLQFICWCIGALCFFTGTYVYIAELPSPFPEMFEFHELYQLLHALGDVFMFVTNLDLVYRYSSLQ